MEGGAPCPRCGTMIADSATLVCPTCGLTLRLPKAARLGITVLGFGLLILLVWAITIGSIFDFMAWVVGLFYNPIAMAFFQAPPAPDIGAILPALGAVIDWLGLNPALPPNNTLLWFGIPFVVLGVAFAYYGARIVRRAQARTPAAA